MKRNTRTTIAFFILLFACLTSAQEDSASSNDIVARLQEAWNQFDSARSAELLNLALNAIEHYPANEQIEIYKFAAFNAFQNGNTPLARTYLLEMLDIDPTTNLDPVTTPPKILTLFQKTKVDYLEEMESRLAALQQKQAATPPSLTFLAPGWEQWRRGYKTKGALLASTSAIALGGLIFSYFDAAAKKDDYAAATDPQKLPALYDSYNGAYKRQFYFAYVLAGLWAASQIDLYLWSPVKLNAAVIGDAGHPGAMVALSIEF